MTRAQNCVHLGIAGDAWSCLGALRRTLSGQVSRARDSLQFVPLAATVVTSPDQDARGKHHALVIWDWSFGDFLQDLSLVTIPCAFSSGYLGEHSTAFALALLMLYGKDIPTYELQAHQGVFARLNENMLSDDDINYMKDNGQKDDLPHDYIVGAMPDCPSGRRTDLVSKYIPQGIRPVKSIIPDWTGCGTLGSHDQFTSMGLKQSQSCTQQPALSAIAAVFAGVKSQLAAEFGGASNVETDALIEQILGGNGKLSQASEPGSKIRASSRREFLAGLLRILSYYAEYDGDILWQEEQAVFAMSNVALNLIDRRDVSSTCI